MINAPQDQLVQYASALAVDMPLTDEQRTLLSAEIKDDPTGRGYKDMAPFDLCGCLATPYQDVNTEQPTLVAKEYIASADLYNYLATHTGDDRVPYWVKIKKLSAGDDPLGVACLLICETIGNLSEIRLGTDQTAEYEELLVGAKLLTQEAADAILKQPDPSYISSFEMPSRLEALGFGAGAVLSIRDLEGLI